MSSTATMQKKFHKPFVALIKVALFLVLGGENPQASLQRLICHLQEINADHSELFHFLT